MPSLKSKLILTTALATAWLPAAAAEDPVALPGIGVEGSAPQAQPPAAAKTNTPIDELPVSIQVVPKALADEQGATQLKDTIRNVSGVSEGGGSSYGFFDRYTSRGLDMNFMSDGMGDGPMTNGYNRTLTGVERVEVLKGPGSALFGSGSPGGTVNVVRAKPQEKTGWGASEKLGSFGGSASTAYVTGNTGAAGALARIDAGYTRTDGYRDLAGETFEFLPTLEWRPGGDHALTVSLEYRHQEQVADAFGIPFQGTRLAKVDRDNRYYTPFSDTEQDIRKLSLAHEWTVSPALTINSRATYTDRDLSLVRNTSGSVAANGFTMTRGIRLQNDAWKSATAQVEPTWSFRAFDTGHTLLTGVEVQRHLINADRWRPATNGGISGRIGDIADIRNPVIPEGSLRDVTFSVHDFDDRIEATYSSAYATDQIDVTDRLKLRGGLRYDYFDTQLAERIGSVTRSRQDGAVSWQAGALYKLGAGFSPFVGVSRSNLANLSSEALGNNVYAPEQATQYEVGVKFESGDKRVSATASAFEVTRENFVQTSGTDVLQASQRTRGVELDLAVEPHPGWRTNANLTLQDARLTDMPATPQVEGLHPLGVPRVMANLWTSWALPGLEGTRLAGGVTYKDKIYQDNANTREIPGYVVADVVASKELGGGFEVAAGVNNLFDREYFVRNTNAGALPGDPRTYFVRGAAKF